MLDRCASSEESRTFEEVHHTLSKKDLLPVFPSYSLKDNSKMNSTSFSSGNVGK